MNQSSTPYSGESGSSGTFTPGHGARRSLQEPVLRSVEEEELDMDTPMHDTGASYTGSEGASMASGTAHPGQWADLQARLARYVGQQPGKAALMALGAGALAALVLGQRMRGRRRRD